MNEAHESVTDEMKTLNVAAESAEAVANKAFEEAVLVIERKRQNFIAKIREMTGSKKEKLKEQLELIEKERGRVRASCEGLEYQVEVSFKTSQPKF